MRNATIDLASAPPDVRAAFSRGGATRVFLDIGHKLYKFTEYPLYKSDGTVTPWWSSVEPLDDDDPGLAGSRRRAAGLGVSDADFARARSAVTKQWNSMSGLLVARMLVPAFALYGRCRHQPADQSPGMGNVVLIGGAWQLWVPNLTRKDVAAE